MAKATESNKITLADLRDKDRSFYVQNLGKDLITANSKDAEFILGPAGSNDSVKVLPTEVAAMPGFQRLWTRGLIKISDSEDAEMADAIKYQSLSADERLAEKNAELSTQIESASSDKDVIEKKCLLTGEPVFQTQAQVNAQVPPLVDRYKDKAHLFTPSESYGPNGLEVTFHQATVGE